MFVFQKTSRFPFFTGGKHAKKRTIPITSPEDHRIVLFKNNGFRRHGIRKKFLLQKFKLKFI